MARVSHEAGIASRGAVAVRSLGRSSDAAALVCQAATPCNLTARTRVSVAWRCVSKKSLWMPKSGTSVPALRQLIPKLGDMILTLGTSITNLVLLLLRTGASRSATGERVSEMVVRLLEMGGCVPPAFRALLSVGSCPCISGRSSSRVGQCVLVAGTRGLEKGRCL
jgi:hypothetical protein